MLFCKRNFYQIILASKCNEVCLLLVSANFASGYSANAQYDKVNQYGNLGLCALFCGKEHLNLSVNFIRARDIVTTP